MKYYTGTDILRVLYVQANHAKDVPNIRKQMARLLQNRHPIEAQYDVHTLESILTVVKTVALSLLIVLLLLGCIALLISGIGIMNIRLGDRQRAHTRDWHSQSDGCGTSRDSRPVPARGILDQRRWCAHWHPTGFSHPGRRRAVSSRQYSRRKFRTQRVYRACSFRWRGCVVRLFAGKPSSATATDRISALRVGP
jgi:hypothetical protein